MRFAAPLEAEFLLQMRSDQRASTLVCMGTALLIWAGFMSADVARLDLASELAAGHRDIIALVLLRLLTLAVMVYALAMMVAGKLTATYARFSFTVLVVIGGTALFAANLYKVRGLPQADLAEFAIMMAVFLPVGLTFRQAVAAAALIACSIAISGPLMLPPEMLRDHARLSSMLLFAGFVGAVGAALREHAQREQFLMRRLLQQHAMNDPLTGIGNRRWFQQRAQAALSQARREGEQIVFAVLDIDHFKHFNDRYGHQAGDEALMRVAETIESCLRRPLDLVARMGGEEFGIVLYGAGPHQAREILDRIVNAVAGLRIEHAASVTAEHLTVSIGAALDNGSDSIESLYKRADALLYASKTQGRNRAEIEQLAHVTVLARHRPQILRRG